MALLLAGPLLVASCSQDPDGGEVGGDTDPEPVMTVRSERDPVTVNGTEVAAGAFVEAAAGDVVAVSDQGSAEITAPSLLRIETLRSGVVTLPDPGAEVLEIGIEVGHIFVDLDPGADGRVVLDAGDRTFTTGTADTRFAVCQSPEGASCLVVLQGEVEWAEEGVAAEVFTAGQASFAGRGNAPDPARCADTTQIGEMQRSMRGVDFEGALDQIVAGWEACPLSGNALDVIEEMTVPSAARMEHVVLAEAAIGSPEPDADGGVPTTPIEGGADFYIEPLTATNGEYRAWLVDEAGDDGETWRTYAPTDWLDRAPGGAATQATYAEGTADEPVRGVSFAAAGAYCASQAKRLPTEIEWELAANAGVLRDLGAEAQDWVVDWEAYGPGPDDADERQVLRGTDAVLEPDLLHRVFAVVGEEDSAARKYARVRCGAPVAAVGGPTFANVVVSDDFNSIDWPTVEEVPFELDYHPENYHLDLSAQHSAMTVVRTLDEALTTGRIDTDLFIERNNTSSDNGGLRFGVVFGTVEDLRVLTVQPDPFTGVTFEACVTPLDAVLAERLDLVGEPQPADDPGRVATVLHDPDAHHVGEHCEDAANPIEVPVPDVANPLRLSVVIDGGRLELWMNDTVIEASATLPSLGVYGFFSETYHRNRSHIHYDSLTITAP